MSLGLCKHFVLTMVAAPRMGKSHLISYLIYDLCVVKKMFNCVVVFTGSPHYYYGLIPEQFIHETYNDDKMRKIGRHQKAHPESELLIIFDDFRGMIKNFHDQNSVHTFSALHSKIDVFVLETTKNIKIICVCL